MTLLQRCLNQLVQRTQSATFSSVVRKNRKRAFDTSASYQSLEQRKLLASLTVDTLADVSSPADLNDGLISLREAITATNTNAAFGDAPAGDATGDSINFASSLAGQTVTLGGSELAIEDDLIIRGNNNITISGNDASRIFRITTAENVVLSRLNFTAGRSLTEGGALLAEGGGTVRLFQSNFSSNNVGGEFADDDSSDASLVGDGGAVYNRGSRLLVSGSSFTDNNANGSGGSLYSEGGLINFSDVTFSGNSSRVAGGAIATDGGQYFFFESTIEQNSNSNVGDFGGGGIYLGGVDASALILASSISGNTSVDGGGIFLEADNRVSIFGDTSIADNIAADVAANLVSGRFAFEGNGGGIYSRGGIVRIGGSEVFRNSAVLKGGGIYSDGGILNVGNSQINGNRTQDDGGGVAVEGTRLIVSGVQFRSNRATGVVRVANQNSSGGAIYIGASDTPSTATILGSSFQFNSSSESGGAIYNAAANTTIGSSFIGGNEAMGGDIGFFGGGGGIFNEGDRLTINSTTIQNNRSFTSSSEGFGGGVFSTSSGILGTRGILNINFSSILNNRASSRGGGLAITGGGVTLFQTNVGNLEGDGNRAGLLPSEIAASRNGFRGEGFGGGIWVGPLFDNEGIIPIPLNIFGGVIANNVANDSGGGLFSRDADVIFRAAFGTESTVFSANRALAEDGGGIYATGGNLRLLDSVFENNTSRNGGGLFVTNNSEPFPSNSGLQTSLNLAGSVVSFNEARRSGGGLFIDEGITVDLDDVTIEANDATFGPDVFEA